MPIRLQNFEASETETFDWGWIRWLMSARLETGAAQTVGVVQIDAGRRNPRHMHPNCEELLYVTAGRCEHILGSDSVTMKPGDLIRIPIGVPHYAECIGDEPIQAIIVFSSGDRQTVVLDDT